MYKQITGTAMGPKNNFIKGNNNRSLYISAFYAYEQRVL